MDASLNEAHLMQDGDVTGIARGQTRDDVDFLDTVDQDGNGSDLLWGRIGDDVILHTHPHSPKQVVVENDGA